MRRHIPDVVYSHRNENEQHRCNAGIIQPLHLDVEDDAVDDNLRHGEIHQHQSQNVAVAEDDSGDIQWIHDAHVADERSVFVGVAFGRSRHLCSISLRVGRRRLHHSGRSGILMLLGYPRDPFAGDARHSGWFPENPKRHDYYERRRKELGDVGKYPKHERIKEKVED